MKGFLGGLSLLLTVSLLGSPMTVLAADEKMSAEAAAAAQEKRNEIRKKQQEKQRELNGSEWTLKLESHDPKAKLKEDTFSFQNNQFRSKNNTERGFTPTNYTITVPEGGDNAIFETMQTGPKGEVIFVRGDWAKDSMSGAISEQMEIGKVTAEYWFTTSKKISVKPTLAEEDWDPSIAGGQDEDLYEPLVSKESTKKRGKADAGASASKGKLVA